MNPLLEASLVKVDAKVAEKMQNVVKFFSRDVYVKVTAPPITELLEEAEPASAKALPSAPDVPTEMEAAGGLSVVVPDRIGVVKAWDFTGTRVHVEFAVLNDSDRLAAIRGVVLTIGRAEVPDAAMFKQFVDVTPDARVPSQQYRLPVVIAAHSGIWLCAELETPIDARLGTVERECALLVVVPGGHASARFTALGGSIFAAVLDRIQKTATDQKGAAALGLPISPQR